MLIWGEGMRDRTWQLQEHRLLGYTLGASWLRVPRRPSSASALIPNPTSIYSHAHPTKHTALRRATQPGTLPGGLHPMPTDWSLHSASWWLRRLQDHTSAQRLPWPNCFLPPQSTDPVTLPKKHPAPQGS